MSQTRNTNESSKRASQLAEALRAAAARASEIASGARVLLYAVPDDSRARPQLRAAAGFSSPVLAREFAAKVGDAVQQVTVQRQEQESTDPKCWIQPLCWDGHVHGALVVAGSTPLCDATRTDLRDLALQTALRLDHATLSEQLVQRESAAAESDLGEEDKNEELLRLSEALFHQDVELLRNNEKLGKIERLKNDFIEKMSRELRTPLNGIIEAIISVLAGENESLSEGAKGSLRAALDDGSAFLRTLQNILDLWRIKQGELAVEIQEVNFREVVEEAIFSVQDALGDKAVTIEKEIVEPLPKLRTDLAKVNQVLFQVLENAVKFTRDGSIHIRVAVTDNELCCEIRDSGVGICPDDRQFLFDEFFQVDAFAAGGYRGAGLGLTLVRDLLTLLDGEIDVESDVGRGSCFTFRIPVQKV